MYSSDVRYHWVPFQTDTNDTDTKDSWEWRLSRPNKHQSLSYAPLRIAPSSCSALW